MIDYHKHNKDNDIISLEFELKKIIEELQIQNEELKKERDRAEKSDKLKSIFLANMSHEIRTPLNSILGFSSLLLNKYYSRKDIKRYLNIINKNGEQLLKLINDIIDLSKLEVDELKLDIEYFNIKKLLTDIYQSFSFNNKIINNKIKFRININKKDMDCLIQTDKYRIEQILVNLISNSIKFTKNGDIIEFGCYLLKSNVLKCYVKDTGIGFNKKDKEIIFNRFIQLDNMSNRKGTGLGLSIVKGLINKLNGDINVVSIQNKGTIFYFTIPININKEKIKKIKKQYKFNFKDINILIVEDIEYNFELIREMLLSTKCNIYWASNGVECLKYMKNKRYDIILLDIRMPVMDGYETIKRIRKINKNIPVIAQTAYAISNDKDKLIQMGCSDYIPKPIKKDDLYSIISKYI
jgi:signal transduction histidine kinase